MQFPLNNFSKDLDRPEGFQEVEASRFVDSRHMKVVRFSAVRIGRPNPIGSMGGSHLNG